jgi:hypothetical protein
MAAYLASLFFLSIGACFENDFSMRFRLRDDALAEDFSYYTATSPSQKIGSCRVTRIKPLEICTRRVSSLKGLASSSEVQKRQRTSIPCLSTLQIYVLVYLIYLLPRNTV